MNTIATPDLVVGKVYQDMPEDHSAISTRLEYVGSTETHIYFKYVGGPNPYFQDDDGLIPFKKVYVFKDVWYEY